MQQFIDLFLHTEEHLREFLVNYGVWIYALLFLIIFCETGVVIMPFLPGDSLLFAVGALAASMSEGLNIWVLVPLLIVAAILGDTLNYSIGRWMGPKVFHGGNRWLKRENLLKAHAFYEKYGGKAIVLARFVPIFRTVVPFVAGVGTMQYRKFIFFNIAGGIAWIVIFLLGGYFLGNLPGVKSNMKMVIVLIIVVSVIPIVYELWKGWREKRRAQGN